MKTQLKPHEYSLDRKKAILENKGIKVEDNQVEEEFRKLMQGE